MNQKEYSQVNAFDFHKVKSSTQIKKTKYLTFENIFFGLGGMIFFLILGNAGVNKFEAYQYQNANTPIVATIDKKTSTNTSEDMLQKVIKDIEINKDKTQQKINSLNHPVTINPADLNTKQVSKDIAQLKSYGNVFVNSMQGLKAQQDKMVSEIN